jgi:Uma2 family endonuclease
LEEKRDAYLRISSLKVLMFVEPDAPEVLLYRRKSGGGFDVESHDGLDTAIPLPHIDVTIPLAELYERVELS